MQNNDPLEMNGVDDFGWDPSALCTLDMTLAYVGGNLQMSFDLGTLTPLDWSVFLVIGALTLLDGPNGIECADLELVDTGP